MLLGFAAFGELPFSTAGPDNSITLTVTKNELTISIGNPGISADSVIETITGNQVTLGIGTVTLTGDANVTGVKNELVLGTGTVTGSYNDVDTNRSNLKLWHQLIQQIFN
jgi:ABC-type uncharacterized transport system ATPase subunit